MEKLRKSSIRAIESHTENTAWTYAFAAQARVDNKITEWGRAILKAIETVISFVAKIADFFTPDGSAKAAADAGKLKELLDGVRKAKSILVNASFFTSLDGMFRELGDFQLFSSVNDEMSKRAEETYKSSGIQAVVNDLILIFRAIDSEIQSPLLIPERSGPKMANSRPKSLQWVRGVKPIIEDINKKFQALQTDVPSNLPAGFPLEQTLAYIDKLRSEIDASILNQSLKGVHFWSIPDGKKVESRAVALGVVGADRNLLNLIDDALINRYDILWAETINQTGNIIKDLLTIYLSNVEVVDSKGIRTAFKIGRGISDLTNIVTLPERVVDLFQDNIHPIDALNQLSMQMTYDLQDELTRLWAIADGVVGVPDGSVGYTGGLIRYLLTGSPFPTWEEQIPAGITIYTNQTSYKEGDTLTLSLSINNSGDSFKADVFLGFVLPDGSIWFFDDSLKNLKPCNPNNSKTYTAAITSLEIPNGYRLPRTPFFSITLPALPRGTYITFAALAKPGSAKAGHISLIEDINLATFTFQGS